MKGMKEVINDKDKKYFVVSADNKAVIWGLLDGEGFSILQGLATILILLGVYFANKRN